MSESCKAFLRKNVICQDCGSTGEGTEYRMYGYTGRWNKPASYTLCLECDREAGNESGTNIAPNEQTRTQDESPNVA